MKPFLPFHAVLSLLLLAAAALSACGVSVQRADASSDASPDAVATAAPDVAAPDAAPDQSARDVAEAGADAAADVPFESATHDPLQVMSRGGATMSRVQLVVITYADDPNRDRLEAFGQWIGTSNWRATIGADYHLGEGSLLAAVRRPENAPDTITSTQLETQLGNWVADGTLPSPADGNFTNVLYMVFFPAHTMVTLVSARSMSQSCTSFGGYHSEFRHNTIHAPYAAVPNCGSMRATTDFDGVTLAASHEYAEAATDPFPMSRPAYVLPANGTTAWGLVGGEVGDLCEWSQSSTLDSGYTVARIFSNSAAAAYHDPCVPGQAMPYYNVFPLEGEVLTGDAGTPVTFTIEGFSDTRVADWRVSAAQQAGNIRVTSTLSSQMINNGRTVTLTVNLPATATSGSYAVLQLSSSPATGFRGRQVWYVGVLVN